MPIDTASVLRLPREVIAPMGDIRQKIKQLSSYSVFCVLHLLASFIKHRVLVVILRRITKSVSFVSMRGLSTTSKRRIQCHLNSRHFSSFINS